MINFSIIVIMDVVCSAARNTGTEKRTLKTILIICLVLVTAAFAAGQVYSRVVTDTVPPVITLDSDSITVSVEDGRDAAGARVTASDAKDGDLTGQIIVSGVSKLIETTPRRCRTWCSTRRGTWRLRRVRGLFRLSPPALHAHHASGIQPRRDRLDHRPPSGTGRCGRGYHKLDTRPLVRHHQRH